MRRLSIDFVVRPLWHQPLAARSRAILIALAALLVFAGAALVWQALRLERQLAETTQAIAEAREEVAARTPLPRLPLHLSAAQVLAINAAIGQLNTPWPALLDAFESVVSADIALLQIEPDGRRHLVKGIAEARDYQGMLDYLAALGAAAPFARALVSKQEINDRDPNQPLRFSFEALFEDGAAPAIDSVAPHERRREQR
ncbi:MAG: hypothetical protein AW10_02395 [Candidatus Accumulibacter appositus]|uniref:PilN domain-containing protein n=1 Tax=Candidatus Accumulibacter appositus TaxID=1454003 RepID=A0A011PR66_9PROT|nr:hypothetical protein [Accumulibacter sp.]EXI79365.1 MAG: hypothetical protein AW10_02395 [Candidatus Accumulibacter appositus]HRF03686.1 hypothetical protein [Accumulibacter sp.]